MRHSSFWGQNPSSNIYSCELLVTLCWLSASVSASENVDSSNSRLNQSMHVS